MVRGCLRGTQPFVVFADDDDDDVLLAKNANLVNNNRETIFVYS
jgi:hypothetical protein